MDQPSWEPALERVRADLEQRIVAVRRDLRAEIAASAEATRTELRAEITASAEATRSELRSEIAASKAELREEISRSAAETRRHFDVVMERVVSRVQLVAEGVAMVDQKVDRLRGDMVEGFERVDRRLLRLEVRVTALEERA